MAIITRFEEIESWQLARCLTNQIYDLSDVGRFSRDFGLRDQMRRAAVSVMSNIAEGFESQTQAMFISYLNRAKASAGEVRAQLYVASDRGYITPEQFDEIYQLTVEISRKLVGFIRYLERQPNARRVREDTAIYKIG